MVCIDKNQRGPYTQAFHHGHDIFISLYTLRKKSFISSISDDFGEEMMLCCRAARGSVELRYSIYRKYTMDYVQHSTYLYDKHPQKSDLNVFFAKKSVS